MTVSTKFFHQETEHCLIPSLPQGAGAVTCVWNYWKIKPPYIRTRMLRHRDGSPLQHQPRAFGSPSHPMTEFSLVWLGKKPGRELFRWEGAEKGNLLHPTAQTEGKRQKGREEMMYAESEREREPFPPLLPLFSSVSPPRQVWSQYDCYTAQSSNYPPLLFSTTQPLTISDIQKDTHSNPNTQ